MKLRDDTHVLVVVGGWNPNIVLNPNWLKKYLFPDQEKFHVEMLFGPGQSPSPCVTAGNIKISVPGNRLCFSLTTFEDSSFDRIQDLACKLADYLPHTPVNAYGVNFVFASSITECNFINQDTPLFKALTAEGQKIKEEHSRYSLHYKNAVLNLTARENHQEEGSGMNFNLDFNFHHPIDDLSQLKAGLDETFIQNYYLFAMDFAKKIKEQIFESSGE